MTRKRTHRRAQPAFTTSWLDAIMASKPIDAAHATAVMNLIRVAFERMRTGAGTDDDFDRVGATLNVGLIRAEQIDQRLVDVMLVGQAALMDADRIRGQHQRYGFTGPADLAMRDALDAYEEVLRASTPRQMDLALREGMRRIRAGHVVRTEDNHRRAA